MGWTQQSGDERRRLERERAGMLSGLAIAVDVQHLYREGAHARDRGALFQLRTGGKLYEADAASVYGAALSTALRSRGASVWANEPQTGILVGPYSRRQYSATHLGAKAYLACHLNAGGGSYALAEYRDSGVWRAPASTLARTIVDELSRSFECVTKGSVRALAEGDRGMVCIRRFEAGPAVLLEPLFGDYISHQPLLGLDGLAAVGEAIARGVADWWSVTKGKL